MPDPIPTSDPLLDQVRDSQRLALSESLRQANSQDPERAAAIVKLATATRLHPSTVAEIEGDAKAAVAVQGADVDGLMRDHPELASWLLDRTNASVAHDDLPGLRALDGLVRQVSAGKNDDPLGILPKGYQFDRRGGIQRVYSEGHFAEGVGDYQGMGADIQRAQREGEQVDIQAAERDQRVGGMANPFVAGALGALGGDLRVLQSFAGTDTTGLRSQLEDIASSSAEQHPGLLNDAARMGSGLVADLPVLLAGGGVAQAAKALGAASTTIRALSPLLGSGKAEKVAERVLTSATMLPVAAKSGIISGQDHGLAYGATDALINLAIPGLFGRVGVQRALAPAVADIGKGGVDAALPAASFLLKQAGLDATQNMTLELATALHEQATGVDPEALTAAKLVPRLGLAGAAGGAMGAVFNLPEALQIRATRRSLAIHQSQAEADALSAATDAALASKTVQRSPEQAAGLVRSVIESTGGTGDTVFAQSGEFLAHFQERGEDPVAAAAAMGVDPATYATAVASHAHSPIPLQGWLTRAREEDKPLLDHVTMRPDGLTRAEAGVATEGLRKDVEQQVAAAAKGGEAKPAADAGAALDESALHVGENVEAQLLAAGRKPEEAKYGALVWQKASRQLAERWNAGAVARGAEPITPEGILQRYRVQVTGEHATTPEAVGRTLNQEAATVAPRDTSLAFSDLRKQWAKAHGERAVDTSSADWARLVQESARVDASNGRVYFQPGDAPQGRIHVGEDKSLSIELLRTANASTFLHETGHAYLEILTDLAGRADVAPGLRDDLATIRTWLGAKDGEAYTNDQHEQFARGFEKWLAEGKAPTRDLRAAFAAFGRWLTKLYGDLSSLRVELTPEVRSVFSRLLASEAEVASAASELHADPFFKTAEAAGMTPAAFARYQRDVAESRVRAADTVRADLMTFEAADARAERERAEGEIRGAATAEVDARPDMQAIAALQDGTVPAGLTLPDGVKLKLDRADIVDRYGEDALKDLPGPAVGGEEGVNAGRRIYAHEGGMPMEDAAILFGYKDADDLMAALTTAPDRDNLIATKTANEMAKRYPDPLAGKDLQAATTAALADEIAGDVVGAEVNALERQTGAEPTPRELIRAAAQRAVDQMTAYSLRPEIYRRAAEKAAIRQFSMQFRLHEAATPEARAKIAAEVLAIAKERLTNLELYTASKRAKTASESNQAWIKQRDTLDARERMGKAGGWEFTVYDAYGQATGTFPSEREALAFTRSNPGTTFDRTSGYLDQWDAIQEGFNLKRASNRALRRRESLRQWVDRMEAEGEPVAIPDQVLADLGRRHWQELTVAEHGQVSDALRNVYHLATMKNRLMAAKRKSDLEAVAGELAASIAQHATGEHGTRLGTTGREKVAEGVFGFLASQRKDSFLARAMDGYQDGGAVWEHFILPRNEAAAEKSTRQAEAATVRDAALKAWDKTSGGARDDIPGTHLRMTREQRIGLALYWGNREGRQRVLSDLERQDRPGTEADVHAVLDSLDAADWALVRATWNQLNSYWHEIASLERRTVGIAPDRVQALPFRTKHGTMEGGYYPIKYDQTQGSKATNIDDATDAKSKLRAANLASSTRRGFTKARAEQVQGRGLRYDFGTVAEHLNEVIHDLTHRELLQDQNRLFRNADVAGAIVKHHGKRALDQLVNTTADIAQGEAPAKSAAERFARKLRQGTSAALFGFNLTSALSNATGLLQAAPRVGVGRLLQAVAHVTGSALQMHNALAEVESRSAFMATRAKTWLREVAEANAATTAKGKLDAVQRAAYWPMSQTQRVIDSITWHAGHDLGLESAAKKGLTGKDAAEHAVEIADQTVIDTQGSGRVGDMAAIMRGGEVSKFFTAFYGYFSTTFNLMAESAGRAVNKGELLQLATNTMLVWALPAVLTDMIGRSLRGDSKEYDLKQMAQSEASYGLGMLVGFRELSGAVQGFSYSGPGSLGLVNRAYELIQQAGQGKADLGLAKAAVGAGLAPFGLPALEAQRLIDAWTIASDRGDFAAGLRAALFGKPRK